MSESLRADWKIRAVCERRDLGDLIADALVAYLKTKKK